MLNFVLVIFYVCGIVIGQILFKRTSVAIESSDANSILIMFTLPSFYIAVVLYGFLTIYWVWLLGRMPISYAYPFSALSVALVCLLGIYEYSENVSLMQIVGVLFVVIGVVLIGISHE